MHCTEHWTNWFERAYKIYLENTGAGKYIAQDLNKYFEKAPVYR